MSNSSPSLAMQALLLLDADFVPTPALAAQVKAPGAYAKLMAQLNAPQTIVLPAFEPDKKLADGRQLSLEAVQRECCHVSSHSLHCISSVCLVPSGVGAWLLLSRATISSYVCNACRGQAVYCVAVPAGAADAICAQLPKGPRRHRL